MKTSETILNLAGALAKAQALINPAPKMSENPFFKSKYADLASVWASCRAPLSKNGLSIVQGISRNELSEVVVTTRLLHESGEWIETSVSVIPSKSDAQGLGAATTYLRRFSLSAMVGIVSDEDDDGNASQHQGGHNPPIPNLAPKGNPVSPVTEPQLKRLAAIANANKWQPADVSLLLHKLFAMDSSKKLNMGQYDEVVRFIENNGAGSLKDLTSAEEEWGKKQ